MPDDLLPPNATPQERALSLATDRLPDVPIKTLWSPQTCPEAQLPWLAWALSVDEWDSTWSVETKRQAIAASIEQHRKKGTVGALRRALQRLGYEVEIDENTGVAYTFRLRFKVQEGESSAGAVLDQAVTAATQIALRQKNARSELLGISLLGEGGTAKLYSAAAPITGAEVDIRPDETTTRPLDSYNVGLLGSFWTVKMHANYTGPIARVRRTSDGKYLSYRNLLELRRFVDGTTWRFVRFFNQTGSGVALTDSTAIEGEFDSNGFPRMKNTTDSSSYPLVPHFAYRIPTQTFTHGTILTAHQTLTTAAQLSAFARLVVDEFDLLGRYLDLSVEYERANTTLAEGGGAWGIGILSTGKSSGAAASRLNPLNLWIEFSAIRDDGGVYVNAPNFNAFNFGPGYDQGRHYGAAFWNRDLGADACASINAAIETYLQL